jgi:hypothetical protein
VPSSTRSMSSARLPPSSTLELPCSLRYAGVTPRCYRAACTGRQMPGSADPDGGDGRELVDGARLAASSPTGARAEHKLMGTSSWAQAHGHKLMSTSS